MMLERNNSDREEFTFPNAPANMLSYVSDWDEAFRLSILASLVHRLVTNPNEPPGRGEPLDGLSEGAIQAFENNKLYIKYVEDKGLEFTRNRKIFGIEMRSDILLTSFIPRVIHRYGFRWDATLRKFILI